MKVVLYGMREYEREAFERQAPRDLELVSLSERLTRFTVDASRGAPAVCCFVGDHVDAEVIERLAANGTRLIALRSAGFDYVDLEAATRAGLQVVRVPEYSPFAVAEHAVALLMALNRKIHRAFNRVRELNFSLEGLVGFDLHGKTVGVIGAGRIGRAFCSIMKGFGCRVLVYDAVRDPEVARLAEYVDLPELFASSDVISLHVPLTKGTHHLMDAQAFAAMKPTAILINTGRGALIDTKALIGALKGGRIGGAALDVYEEEEGVFFRDLSSRGLADDQLARLLTFPNVLVTAHQAFLTREALDGIARVTLENLRAFRDGRPLVNRVAPPGPSADA